MVLLLAVGMGSGSHANKESLAPAEQVIEQLGLGALGYSLLCIAPILLSVGSPLLWGAMWTQSSRKVILLSTFLEMSSAASIVVGLSLLQGGGIMGGPVAFCVLALALIVGSVSKTGVAIAQFSIVGGTCGDFRTLSYATLVVGKHIMDLGAAIVVPSLTGAATSEFVQSSAGSPSNATPQSADAPSPALHFASASERALEGLLDVGKCALGVHLFSMLCAVILAWVEGEEQGEADEEENEEFNLRLPSVEQKPSNEHEAPPGFLTPKGDMKTPPPPPEPLSGLEPLSDLEGAYVADVGAMARQSCRESTASSKHSQRDSMLSLRSGSQSHRVSVQQFLKESLRTQPQKESKERSQTGSQRASAAPSQLTSAKSSQISSKRDSRSSDTPSRRGYYYRMVPCSSSCGAWIESQKSSQKSSQRSSERSSQGRKSCSSILSAAILSPRDSGLMSIDHPEENKMRDEVKKGKKRLLLLGLWRAFILGTLHVYHSVRFKLLATTGEPLTFPSTPATPAPCARTLAAPSE